MDEYIYIGGEGEESLCHPARRLFSPVSMNEMTANKIYCARIIKSHEVAYSISYSLRKFDPS